MKRDEETIPMNPIKGNWEKIKELLATQGDQMHKNYIEAQGDNGNLRGLQNIMNQKAGLNPVGVTDPMVPGLPGIPNLPGTEIHMANGGEVQDQTWLEKLAQKLHGSALTSDADNAESLLHLDDPQTSSDTVKNYADGGEVQPSMWQQIMNSPAANVVSKGVRLANDLSNPFEGAMDMASTFGPSIAKAEAPLVKSWLGQPTPPPPPPQTDPAFIAQLNAGTAIAPPSQPQPNAIMGASQKMQSLPSTPSNIYQGMTAEDRNALMQKLIARKSSPGMLLAKGAAGLGDAITSAFGKSPTQAMQGIRENEAKDSEQRIGAMDTERTQKLQDLQANQDQALNDPNSSLSQSMRKTLKSAGLNVPSGMSGAIMLKISGPLGELAMKQAAVEEQRGYHQGELGSQAAERERKTDEYRSEHPILNYLNPVGDESPKSPVSNPHVPHGIPDLGSTFNGEKVMKVTRIK